MMATIWNYTVVFFQMVLVPCITVPANWEHCSKIDQWLIPDIQQGVEIYFNPSSIYAEERKYLENINKERK
jgi:hypothetical protein